MINRFTRLMRFYWALTLAVILLGITSLYFTPLLTLLVPGAILWVWTIVVGMKVQLRQTAPQQQEALLSDFFW